MSPVTRVLLTGIALFGFAGGAIAAQDRPTATSGRTHEGPTLVPPTKAGTVVLYDQYNNANGLDVTSQDFEAAFNAYDSFELTLVFEKAGNVVVEVVVEEAETTAPHKH